MARKRVVEPSGVKTWEDANDALRQIAEAQLALADIEGEMNKQILGAKKAAEEQSKPYKDRVAKLERELEAAQTRYDELMTLMASEELYDDKDAFDKAMSEYSQLKPRLAKLEEEWLELSAQMESQGGVVS